jgi:hypothetical protein
MVWLIDLTVFLSRIFAHSYVIDKWVNMHAAKARGLACIAHAMAADASTL